MHDHVKNQVTDELVRKASKPPLLPRVPPPRVSYFFFSRFLEDFSVTLDFRPIPVLLVGS